MKQYIELKYMANLRKIFSFLFLMTTTLLASAQQNVLEETFYRSGKITVVIAVATVVLLGIFAYLIRLDRKITALEKKTNSDNLKK